MSHTCVLIPGDGIGPEVADATKRVLEASRAPLDWISRPAGVAALEQGHDAVLPQTTIDAILEHGLALKGPCTTPVGGGFSSVNVALRKTLQLYGAVRPVRSLDGVNTRFQDVDIVVVKTRRDSTRESTMRSPRGWFHPSRSRPREPVTESRSSLLNSLVKMDERK